MNAELMIYDGGFVILKRRLQLELETCAKLFEWIRDAGALDLDKWRRLMSAATGKGIFSPSRTVFNWGHH
jgi:hypothetical protein